MKHQATSPLRVLVIHNRYREAGGEDSVFANEVALLRSGGCEVSTLIVSNDDIQGLVKQASTAFRTISNPAGRALVADALRAFQPAVVHVHNFFPKISPTVFDACADAGVPAVWTLHNFRVACANGLLFRNDQPCDDCVGRAPWPAVVHRCYRGSALGSATVAAMIAYHRARGTWRRKVPQFIALTDFARDIVVRAGLPRDRVAVKPNFVSDPRPALGNEELPREGMVFVGRLSPEKGAGVLIDAWRDLPDLPLTIVGDGPERERLEAAAPANVRFVGFQERENVLRAVAGARALIVPSIWYENFPMTVVEAMALGTPVIASRIGALKSIVTEGVDGLHFVPGDPRDLARVARLAIEDGAMLDRLGAGARETWRATMSPEHSLTRLLAIYGDVMAISDAAA